MVRAVVPGATARIGLSAAAGRAAIGLALSVAVLSGCGITTLPFLEAPIAGVASTVDQTFEFDGPDPLAIDPLLFEGYELYYRFYANSGDGPADLSSLTQVTGAGFQRLHQAGDTDGGVDRPLVAVPFDDRDDPHSVTITVRFGQTPTEPWLTGSWDPGTVELRRATTDAFGFHQVLSDTSSFDASHSDVAELFVPALKTTSITLLIYAFTYGRDFSVDVHSEAEYLGEIVFVSYP